MAFPSDRALRSLFPFTLLCAEAFALGLGLGHLSLGQQLTVHLGSNSVPPEALRRVFLIVLATLLLLPSGAMLLSHWRSTSLERVSAALLPLLLFPGILILWQVTPWIPHSTQFLLMTLLFSLLCGKIYTTMAGTFTGPVRLWTRTLDALSGSKMPLLLLASASLAYATYFSIITVRAHWDGYTSTFDLGIYDNVFYNTVHFNKPLFKCSPLRGPTGGHFPIHATFFLFALAPIYALIQRAETLLVLQAIVVSSGTIPLFLFARRRVGPRAATALALCYLLYAPLHGANLYHFHFLTLSPPFVLWVAYALQERKNTLLVIAFILAVSVREDIGFGVAALGSYFIVSRERPRAGLWVAIAGLASTLLIKLVLMPKEGSGESFIYMYEGMYPPHDASLGGVAKTVLANPGFLLRTLISPERINYLLLIFVPVLFLPWKRPATWVLFASGFAFTLLMGRTSAVNSLAPVMISFQYTAQWTPYVFLATAIALGGAQNEGNEASRGLDLKSRGTLVAIAASILITSHQFGAIFQTETSKAGFIPFHTKTTAAEYRNRATRARIVAQIPKNVPVAASDCLVPHVSQRPNAYNFHGNPFNAEYIVSEFQLPCAPPNQVLQKVLSSGEFGVVALEAPYILLKRGASTEKNGTARKTIARPAKHKQEL